MGLRFKNQIGLAAGFDKNCDYFKEFSSFGFGFIEVGTVTPLAQKGNSKPRLFRIKSDNALINRLGFNNKGLDYMIDRLKKIKSKDNIVGVNIGKNKDQEDFLSDYEQCFVNLHKYVDYFTVNVSSPNTPGLRDLQNVQNLKVILKSLVKINNSFKIRRPILLKISPDLNDKDIIDIVKLLLYLKIDGIICTNTTVSREKINLTENNISKIGPGGLSGRPLFNRSNQIIKLVRDNVPEHFIIVGVGGILSAEDAIAKIKLGANLVQIYTGLVYEGPLLIKDIKKKIIEHESKNQ